MHFPGFVSAYRDNLNKTHIYFFRGISENDKPIYRPLDFVNVDIDYKFTTLSDKAVDYVFESNIKSVTCKLIESDTGKVHHIKLNIPDEHRKQ